MLMKIFYLEGNSKKMTRSHPVVEVIHQHGENMDENQLPAMKLNMLYDMLFSWTGNKVFSQGLAECWVISCLHL